MYDYFLMYFIDVEPFIQIVGHNSKIPYKFVTCIKYARVYKNRKIEMTSQFYSILLFNLPALNHSYIILYNLYRYLCYPRTSCQNKSILDKR